MIMNKKSGRWWLLFLFMGAASCSSSDPEDFCASRVADTCKALSGCCGAGAKFDQEGCEIEASAQCQKSFPVEGVHAGEYVFDEGAASTCLGSVSTCEEATSPKAPTKDQLKACGNMITGFRPVGSACDSSAECEKAGGDFPVCYDGKLCAKAILSEDECGFSFDKNELKECLPGMYCDVPETSPGSSDGLTKDQLEFTGTCKPPLGKGQPCFSNGRLLPCQDGLYCDTENGSIEASVCAAQVGEGQPCFSGEECASGLYCGFDEAGPGPVCTSLSGASGLFCVETGKCGNGVCEAPTESNVSCPQDCSDQCGDGICEQGETPDTCAIDC